MHKAFFVTGGFRDTQDGRQGSSKHKVKTKAIGTGGRTFYFREITTGGARSKRLEEAGKVSTKMSLLFSES